MLQDYHFSENSNMSLIQSACAECSPGTAQLWAQGKGEVVVSQLVLAWPPIIMEPWNALCKPDPIHKLLEDFSELCENTKVHAKFYSLL